MITVTGIAMTGFMIAMPPKKFCCEPVVMPPIARTHPITTQSQCSIGQPKHIRKLHKYGCVVWDRKKKPLLIIIDKQLTQAQYDKVLAHEKGHLCGWPQER